MTEGLSVIIHGGAVDREVALGDHREKPILAEALDAAWERLATGRPGEEAVAAALKVMEGCEFFDSGFGSFLNEHGKVRLDVALMRGNGDFISLVNIARVKYPSALALDHLAPGRSLMAVWTEDRMRALDQASPEKKSRYGYVATEEEMIAPFARMKTEFLLRDHDSRGMAWKPATLGHDTVGCVVRDGSGRIAAGTSTGGIAFKPDGRVGDSPLIGAGVYADDTIGGLSATGAGETIIKSTVSAFVIAEMRRLMRDDPDIFSREPEALRTLIGSEIDDMARRYPGTMAGLIVMPVHGRPAYAFNSPGLCVATRTGSARVIDHEEIQVAVHPTATA
jgi:beta-aspartyl-peptidase (threonine type)